MCSGYEYQCKRREETWETAKIPYLPLGEEHKFSLNLDYRFRLVFVPGYFQYEGDGNAGTRAVDHVSIHWFERDPGDGYNRVNITPAE